MQRVGVATFAVLVAQIAGSVIGFTGVGLRHPSRFGPGIIAWMAMTLVVGIALCILLVIYLRHLFRHSTAPRSKVLWTFLLFFLGVFAMSYYWLAYMRRQPQPAS